MIATHPYQALSAPLNTPEHAAAFEQAVHVILPDGRMLRAGRAVLHALSVVGYGGLVWPLRFPPMIWFVELGYGIVARNRRFFSRFLFREE